MTHQQLLAHLAVAIEACTEQLRAARLSCKVSTVTDTRQRVGKVEHELANLACAAKLAGAMNEATQQAFEGVGCG